MKSMFNECKELEYLDLSNFDTSNVTDMMGMFMGCHKLKEIKGLNNFNTSKVTDIEAMFMECYELEYLDISNFDILNVTSLQTMFSFCHKLRVINGLNVLNTKNITKLPGMFNECKELVYVDLSNFDTSNVTDMRGMFSRCYKIKEIKGINNFNTINVQNFIEIFAECSELKSLDLSKFNTSKVDNMSRMFDECYELEYLDLSNFDTSNVTNMKQMFHKCYNLKQVKGISNFDIDLQKVNTEEMIDECNEFEGYRELKDKLNPNKKQEFNLINTNNIKKQKLTIYFSSIDQNINCSFQCFNTDIFAAAEEKLLLEFPKLKNRKCIFIANGNVISKSMTLLENKIKDEAHILINFND
jgi:surface protein